MGVEYAHGLFVVDLKWKPALANLEAIHRVLRTWKLAKAASEMTAVGDDTKLSKAAVAKAMPANLRVGFGEVHGKPVVGVMGDSQYELEADERYLQDVYVVLGVDFKVLASETYEIEVTTPPKNGKAAVEVDDFAEIGGSSSYPATWTTSPPKTRAPGAFTGVWRSGLILDCGKDLPSIAEECTDPLPAKKFRKELELAFGTKLVEQGWIY